MAQAAFSRFVAGALTALALLPVAALAQEVNVYTYREPALVKPLFDAFTKESGVKVNVVFAADGLEERIKAEGALSPADMLLTVDIARLQKAVDLGLTQTIESSVLNARIPAAYRDPANRWFGISVRARVVYASKERVADASIKYEDLADPKWKGKICMRDGQHIYNNALIAAHIAHFGAEKTESWLRGFKANLAQKPSGGDREVARDIAAGKCDIGLGNTYYVALMQEKEPQRKAWADAVKVLLPEFATGGSHVNVSGFILAKHAPNRANALKLAEFLTGKLAQELYADANFEYPVVEGTAANAVVKGFGPLKADPLPIAEIARHRAAASDLVNKTGFNEGPGS